MREIKPAWFSNETIELVSDFCIIDFVLFAQ